MNESNKDLNGSLKEMVENFRKTIPEKMKNQNVLFSNFEKDQSQENIDALFGYLHKQKGSAGMYGYQNVSKETQVAVEIVRPYKDKKKNPPLSQEEVDQVKKQLELVNELFQKEPDLTSMLGSNEDLKSIKSEIKKI
jgi:chemotaxis protein histidine kinase CheA